MFMDWVISRAGAGINTLSILKYDNVSCIFLLQEKLRNIFHFKPWSSCIIIVRCIPLVFRSLGQISL